MPESDDLAARLLASTGARAFARDEKGVFRPLGPTPTDLEAVVERAVEDPEGHGFLGSFFLRAEEAWADEGQPPLDSGPWHEETSDGHRILEATAVRIDGRQLLILRDAGPEHSRRQALLQGAREALLESERLSREMQLRDLLLHAIVHDLGGPLTSLQASLHLLHDPELSSDERAEVEDILSRSVGRLRDMQAEILRGFREELRTLDPGPVSSPAGPPDLLACTLHTVEALRPAARERSVELRFDRPDRGGQWIGIGETSRLERVLANLVENALRHAPAGSVISVRLGADERNLHVQVEDSGPGVTPALVPSLFLRGTQGGSAPGQSGLGLYFARLTIERWGGSVGYEPRSEGGSRFWFRIPRREVGTAIQAQ